jgi:hypothetical protein
VSGGEVAQHVDGVVADGVDGDAFAFEVGEAALQLNELRATEGSPTGAAVEDDQPAAVTTMFVKIERRAALVR